MKDDCLLELHSCLTPEAAAVFEALVECEKATMERLMRTAQLTNQQVRRGVWGLACTGLIVYDRGRPVCISEDGDRLAELLGVKTPERG